MTTLKDQIAEAAIAHVPFDGMNDVALANAGRDLGLSREAVRVHFPAGGADLAEYIHRRDDQRLAAWLAGEAPGGRYRDRIEDAVWHRLQIADVELVRAAAAVLALPQNAARASRMAWETADTIWSGLGDSSRDVNWYTKRATLAAVHSATVLYWLGDQSEGKADTRAFLERRIDDVMRVEKLKANLRKLPGASALGNILTGWVRAPGPADDT